jgi:hypothetical protein
VQYVALVPDSGSMWTNPNLRQFKTEVSIRDGTIEAKPGMSCSVEILVESIENALSVPVQANHRSGGKTICFVRGAQREVEVGASSEAWVQILSGLEEGEIVALNPPPGFKPEPDPEGERELPSAEFPVTEGMPGGMPSNGAGGERMPGGADRSGGTERGAGRPPREGGGPRPEGGGLKPDAGGPKPAGAGSGEGGGGS